MEKSNTEQDNKKELPPFDKFVHFLVGQLEPLMENYLNTGTDDSNCEILFECKVTPDRYERNLFATWQKEGAKKRHHSELIAEGFFSQEAFEVAATAIEQEIRKLPEYKENGYFEFPLR